MPDFSGVGYLSGATLPTTYERGGDLTHLAHQAGDQTARLQAAIVAMTGHPLSDCSSLAGRSRSGCAPGYRGTLSLGAGTWQVSDTLLLNVSGVVLQGEPCHTCGLPRQAEGVVGHTGRTCASYGFFRGSCRTITGTWSGRRVS